MTGRVTLPVAVALATTLSPTPATSLQQQTWPATLEARSDPGLHLAWVTALAVDSNRRAFVVDAGRNSILVLGADLTLEQEVGREGEGPGEFKWPTTIQILEGDSLYVYDGLLLRVTVFQPRALAVAYTIPLSLDTPGALWRIPGQRGYVGLRSLSFSVGQKEDDHGRFDIVFLLGKDGDVESDSIHAVPAAEPLVARTETSVMVGSHPFGAESFLSFLGTDRLVYANSRVPTVELLDLAGTLQNSFDVPATPVPVSDAELRATIENEQAEPFVRVLEEGAPYMWPALTGLVVDDEGRIWVGERLESMGDEWEWTAFTDEGSAVGSVRLPSNFELHAVRDGRLFGVATDELDVPRVQVYRLEGG